MGGSKVSAHWAVRIGTDCIYDFESLLFTERKLSTRRIAVIPEFIFYVEEIGRKSGHRHYHLGLTYSVEMTKNYIDRLFKTLCPGQRYSSKPWDGDHGYIRYCHKENVPKFCGSRLELYSHEEYQRLERAFRQQQKEKRRLNLFDDIIDYLRNDEIFISAFVHDEVYFMNIVFKQLQTHYLNYHREKGLLLKAPSFVRTDYYNILFKYGNLVGHTSSIIEHYYGVRISDSM